MKRPMLKQVIAAALTAFSLTSALAYTDVAYVEATGSQAVDTGFFVTPRTRITADFAYTAETVQQRVFGAAADTASPALSCALYINGSSKFAWAMQDGKGNWKTTDVAVDTARHQFVLDSVNNKYVLTTGTVTNKTDKLGTTRTKTAVWPLAIFANRNSDTKTLAFNNYGKVKLYGFIIETNSAENGWVKVMDLKPCLNDNGVPGLRNVVPNPKVEFYSSHGENALEYSRKFVWKGTGTTAEANRWSVGSNWEGGVAPTADDFACCISIPAAAQGSVINNDIVDLQVGELNIASSAAFTLAGEPVALTDAGTLISTTPNFRCEMPLVLAEGATNSFSIAKGLTNTFAADTLRGKGGLKKIEEGTVILEGDNTFEGDVILYHGFVKMSTPNALGSEGKTVRVGPNHVQTENHTQLNLTTKMDFKYNLEFVRQTGATYYGAKYLTCPGGTQIYGTIRVGETTGMNISLGPDSGTLTCYGDVSIYAGTLFLAGTVDFRGRILRSGTATATVSCQANSANFYAPGNTFDQINQGYAAQNFYGENLLHDAFIFNTAYQAGTGAIKLNGYDQVCGGFVTSSSYWNNEGAHHPVETPVGQPCRLTIKPSANCTGRYHFNGPITLVVDSSNGRTQAVVNAESTMTGELIVSNGAFKVGYKAPFPYVPGFEIGANGRLVVTNGVTVGTGDSDFRLTTGGRLVLESGATMSVNRLCKDGETVMSAYGKTFCAPGAGIAGAEEADWIEGSGSLTVNPRVIEDDERTWTGGAGAGGENESMLDPRNWEPGGTAPTLVEGGLFPTFATEGTNAWFAGNLDANGFIFNAPNDFNVTAKDADGTVHLGADGIAATGAHTYTVDAMLEMLLGQTWTAAKDTTLALARGVTASGALTLSLEGGGTFVMEGDVPLTGNIDLFASTLILRDCALSSTSGKLVAQDAATRIRLENAVVSKPITAFSGASPQLTSGKGTTNVVKSYVTWSHLTGLSIEKDSQLTFAGGVGSIGWSGATGAGKDVSTLVVTNGALSGAKITLTSVTAHLWSSGNYAHSGLQVDSNAKLFLRTTNVLTTDTPFCPNGPVDFCGKNQQCGFLKSSSDTGEFYSETPAVLTVNQAGGADAVASTFTGHFKGAAGLRKRAATTLTLNATNPTTGSLEVAGGELVMGASATWGGTEVSVTAADARLSLQGANNLVKHTVLKVTDAAARVNVAAGVQVRVQQMYVPSASRPGALKQLGPGVYTSANSPYVTGEGSIAVRGMGLVLFVN